MSDIDAAPTHDRVVLVLPYIPTLLRIEVALIFISRLLAGRIRVT